MNVQKNLKYSSQTTGVKPTVPQPYQRSVYANGFRYLLLVAIACFISACDKEFRSETEVNSDGSIQRAIYQPLNNTPDEAQDPSHWERVTLAKEHSFDKWTGSIRNLPLDPILEKDKTKFFAAWGSFDSVDEIPLHYRVCATGMEASAQLIPKYRKNDYGLFVEHYWEEVLTDVIQTESLDKSKREYLKFLSEILIAMVEDMLGETYDVTELNAWILEELGPFASDCYNLFFYSHSQPIPLTEEALARQVFALMEDYGFPKISVEELEENENNFWEDTVNPFLVNTITEKVKSKQTGAPLSSEERRILSKELTELILDSSDDGPGQKSYEKVVIKLYGNEETFARINQGYMDRLFGVHDSIGGSSQVFRYKLSLPGQLLESTGVQLDDQSVQWNFRTNEAYPFGYYMRSRSVESRPDVQRQLLGKAAFTDRAAILTLIDAVGEQDDIREALAICGQQRSMEPFQGLMAQQLENYRLNPDKSETPPLERLAKSRIGRVSRLLEIELPKPD